ncbi:MAG: hypothetical protein D6732_22085 [Methanobacteriota archaeon]|nr:MAG: hypothetical protein D6732_22085 [Euryarchaeota archaeon]
MKKVVLLLCTLTLGTSFAFGATNTYTLPLHVKNDLFNRKLTVNNGTYPPPSPTSIIKIKDHYVAIIAGKQYHLGDIVRGYTIKHIDLNRIIFQKGKQIIVRRMF